LAALVEERKEVIEDEEHGGKRRVKGEKGGAGVQVDAEDMVQKEAQRLEVMKRRQERELNQMVAYELMRKEMQVIHPPWLFQSNSSSPLGSSKNADWIHTKGVCSCRNGIPKASLWVGL